MRHTNVLHHKLPLLPVFVYGSLLTGMHNNSVIADSTVNVRAGTVSGVSIYANGFAFPFAVLDSEGVVQGELVDLHSFTYASSMYSLDALEGHVGDPQRDMYDRIVIDVFTADGDTVKAWMYVASERIAPQITAQCPHVSNGDWRNWMVLGELFCTA